VSFKITLGLAIFYLVWLLAETLLEVHSKERSTWERWWGWGMLMVWFSRHAS